MKHGVKIASDAEVESVAKDVMAEDWRVLEMLKSEDLPAAVRSEKPPAGG